MMYCFTLLQSQNYSNDFTQLMALPNFGNFSGESCYPLSPETNMPGMNFSFEPFIGFKESDKKNATQESYSN